MPARRALAVTALLVGGSSGGSGSGGEDVAEREPLAWLDARYDEGRLSFSYPRWWKERDSGKYGTLLTDTRTRYPGFVSVRYLESHAFPVDDEFAARVGRLLRPPDGRGLTLLYTQTALLGGRRGVEAASRGRRAATRRSGRHSRRSASSWSPAEPPSSSSPQSARWPTAPCSAG